MYEVVPPSELRVDSLSDMDKQLDDGTNEVGDAYEEETDEDDFLTEDEW